MTVSLLQWSALIGIFNCRMSVVSTNCECKLIRNFVTMFEILLLCYYYLESTYLSFLTLLYMFILLQCHGDIEKKSRSEKTKKKSLPVCHWNLNSLPAHNFSKLTQLKAYISMYKHDFICLSETYLGSSVSDSLLKIDGYNLVRADHPSDTKRGGVCIYYKESIPARVINLSYFEEALLLEMTYHNKKVIVSVIYRSPSQNINEIDSFLSNLEKVVSDINNRKPALSIITGDFNARSQSWWSNDFNTTEGSKLLALSSSNGFSQLIDEPTRIKTNSTSCIDLIFTDKPGLSVDSGVHSSLHPNYHHQIIYFTFNLNICYPHHIND